MEVGFNSLKDKNLLVIVSGFPDEHDRYIGSIFVKEQLKYFDKYFKEVYVIAPIPYGFSILNSTFFKNYSFKNVRVFFPRFLCVPVGKYKKRLGKHFYNATIEVINTQDLDFDIVHAHFVWPSSYVGIKLKHEFGTPVISFARGEYVRIPLTNYKQSFDNKFLKNNLNSIVKHSDMIISHHEELYDLLVKAYPKYKNKIKFVYKGVDLKRFNPYDKHLNQKILEYRKQNNLLDKFIVLFLARLDPFKDPITFVESAKLLKDYHDIVFIMVGGGPLYKTCLYLKKKYKLSNLKLLGFQSNREFWLGLSDVFVALSPIENIWSSTLQEALVMGVPTIVTNVGYTSKVLTDKEHVLMIPPKNPKSLADAILLLKHNTFLRDKLRNPSHWRSIFDYKKTAKDIAKLSYEVINL